MSEPTRLWKKKPPEQIRERIFAALKANTDYYRQNILGVPASYLDDKVFYQDAPFLANAPFLSTLIHNPNHIGCHTLEKSEPFFKGTQEIEREVIEICAKEILKGTGNYDGYIASGGTEANMQAIWVYRNYFVSKGAGIDEIAIFSSEDAHYSLAKAANILNIAQIKAPVSDKTREIDWPGTEAILLEAGKSGIRYIIAIANMMTTMFGSVDDVDEMTNHLSRLGMVYKLHIDGAYGGFFYPFSAPEMKLNFANTEVSSVTLDAHKMLQAPYGTGIFLSRKGLVNYANTQEASYVEGEDFTIIGSRSGANAIAVWMILMTYGPHGWHEKILVLLNRTDWLCKQLSHFNVRYYRQQHSNIVAIQADQIDPKVAKTYGLVPDNHKKPKWYKIVVMDHVTIEKMEPFINALHSVA